MRDGKTHYLYIQFCVHQIFITWFHIFFFWIFLFLFWFLKIHSDKQQSTDYIMNYHENPFLYMISIPENTEIQSNWNIRGTKHFHFRGNDNNIDILCSSIPISQNVCISNDLAWAFCQMCVRIEIYIHQQESCKQLSVSVIQFQRKKKHTRM